MSQQEESFNPEYNPLGAEGSIDTNAMPWISVKDVKGLSLKNPTIIGFGISDKESFKQACKYSHGAIIGTKFIKEISNGNLRGSIKDFIASIRS